MWWEYLTMIIIEICVSKHSLAIRLCIKFFGTYFSQRLEQEMTTAEWRRLGQGPVKITIVTDPSQTLSREPPAAPNPPTRSTSVASLSVTTILVFARALLQSREAPSPSTPSGPIVRASSIRAVSTTLSHSSRHLSDWPAKLHFNSQFFFKFKRYKLIQTAPIILLQMSNRVFVDIFCFI